MAGVQLYFRAIDRKAAMPQSVLSRHLLYLLGRRCRTRMLWYLLGSM